MLSQFGRATISCAISSLLPALFFLPLALLGLGDFVLVFIWTIPFATGLGLIAALSSNLLARFSPGARLASEIIVGAATALLWAAVISLLGGPWVGLPVWVLGGAVGMVGSQPTPAKRLQLPPAVVGTLPLAFIMLAALLGYFLFWLLIILIR